MAFGIAGAAAGASDALQDILTRAFVRQQQQQEMALRQRQTQLQEDDARDRRERETRNQKLREAQIAVGQAESMGPGVELSPDILTAVQGTPYAGRLEQKTTLPSRSVEGFGPARSDAGGRAYGVLAPTAAQMRETADRSRFTDLVADPSLSAPARRLIDLERLGVRGLNVHDVEGPEVHRAHVEREGRESEDRANRIARYQHDLAVQRDVRNENTANRITQKDILGLYRDAHTRAAADYRAQAALGVPPTDAQGNELTPDQLAQEYVNEMLGALDAYEQQTTPTNGRRVITGIRARVSPDELSPQSQRLISGVNGIVPRQSGPGGTPSVSGTGRTATIDDVRKVAQRAGIPESEARRRLEASGVVVK
jgi:hypothetical protein